MQNFVEFLAVKSRKHAALDRLLAIAPALEAAGDVPMSENEMLPRSNPLGPNDVHAIIDEGGSTEAP